MGELNVESRSLFIADNLEILRGINSECIDLIATDPPFNKGVKAFQGITTAGTNEVGGPVSYKDVWTWADDVQGEWTESIRQDHPNLHAVIRAANAAAGEDMGAYLCWLGVRILEMHRILKPTGSMYLHIDHTAHAYVKTMMDAVFGRKNFRNEIVWCYSGGGVPKRDFPRKHDTILRYTKSNDYSFTIERKPYKENTQQVGIHSTYTGHNPIDLERGTPVTDWWTDIATTTGWSPEHTGYPTQKPLALYERIIKASSNPSNIVLDPFAGCATTCVAAERLDRGWIGIDVNEPARTVVLDRLQTEVKAGMNWKAVVKTPTEPPDRTDDGSDAAPELVLVSPKPKTRNYSARELRERLIMEVGLKCQGCGWIPHHEEYLEVDHRVPKSLGGRDSLNNRVLLCSPCNSAKGNRLSLAELRERRLEENRMADTGWNREWYERVGRFG